MDIDFHFIHDQVAAKTLSVQFCNSEEQLANIFTKPLVWTRFSHFCLSLHVVNTSFDSQGHINK